MHDAVPGNTWEIEMIVRRCVAMRAMSLVRYHHYKKTPYGCRANVSACLEPYMHISKRPVAVSWNLLSTAEQTKLAVLQPVVVSIVH